jgi:membrane protein DedA with SNARE-associated domain
VLFFFFSFIVAIDFLNHFFATLGFSSLLLLQFLLYHLLLFLFSFPFFFTTSLCLLPLLVAPSLGYAHHAKYTFALFLFFLFCFVLVCEIRAETKRRSRKEKKKETKE